MQRKGDGPRFMVNSDDILPPSSKLEIAIAQHERAQARLRSRRRSRNR